MRKKYVLVGTGSRSSMYLEAIAGEYKEAAEICAICDTNQTRMNYYQKMLLDKHGVGPVPTY